MRIDLKKFLNLAGLLAAPLCAAPLTGCPVADDTEDESGASMTMTSNTSPGTDATDTVTATEGDSSSGVDTEGGSSTGVDTEGGSSTSEGGFTETGGSSTSEGGTATDTDTDTGTGGSTTGGA